MNDNAKFYVLNKLSDIALKYVVLADFDRMILAIYSVITLKVQCKIMPQVYGIYMKYLVIQT
jgi:hypothetical protein